MLPVIVRLENAGPGVKPRLYVNSKSVPWGNADEPWKELHRVLKEELKVRPEWVIYIEGDPNLPWADAVGGADVARGLNAKVILLTPETLDTPEKPHRHGKQ